MPKGIATCTCRRCGNTFEKELYETGKGATKRLDEKIAWAEAGGIDLCPECWATEKREAEKKAGLTCKIRLDSPATAEPKVWAVFGGDSYSHKDELKALGARWTEYYPADGAFASLLMLAPPPKAWALAFAPEELDAMTAKIAELGVAEIEYPTADDQAVWAALHNEYMQRHNAKQQAKQAALDELGPIPAWPDSIKAKWPEGARWNGTVYGKPGRRNVYFGGKRVDLTDEEAEAMEATSAARAAWREKKKAIDA